MKITNKDFILAIKSYPELYNSYKRQAGTDVKRINKLWARFAKENHIKNGATAKLNWRKLVQNYASFVVCGTPFAHEREMQFMQMVLLKPDQGDSQADSDIDEEALKRILDSSDVEDCPSDSKNPFIDLTDDGAESKQEDTRIEEQKFVDLEDEVSSPQTNVAMHFDYLAEHTNSVDSQSCVKMENTRAAKHKVILSHDGKDTTNNNVDGNSTESAVECRATTVSNSISNTDNAIASSNFTNLSPLELIFLGYAKVLQCMPLRLQLQTKRKIANIMDEAELQMLEEK